MYRKCNYVVVFCWGRGKVGEGEGFLDRLKIIIFYKLWYRVLKIVLRVINI